MQQLKLCMNYSDSFQGIGFGAFSCDDWNEHSVLGVTLSLLGFSWLWLSEASISSGKLLSLLLYASNCFLFFSLLLLLLLVFFFFLCGNGLLQVRWLLLVDASHECVSFCAIFFPSAWISLCDLFIFWISIIIEPSNFFTLLCLRQWEVNVMCSFPWQSYIESLLQLIGNGIISAHTRCTYGLWWVSFWLIELLIQNFFWIGGFTIHWQQPRLYLYCIRLIILLFLFFASWCS